jgi:hypothetical protein
MYLHFPSEETEMGLGLFDCKVPVSPSSASGNLVTISLAEDEREKGKEGCRLSLSHKPGKWLV